jgi:AcrR family transcriptional regulator
MGMPVKRVQKIRSGAREAISAKPSAIVLAALELFTRYGYRKTSVDDIAQAAQVAKRTVYLHFENKAAVFLAILEYLGDQVRQRSSAAESKAGTPVDRLTGLLDAYFGMVFELFSKSEQRRNWRDFLNAGAVEDRRPESGNTKASWRNFCARYRKRGKLQGRPMASR